MRKLTNAQRDALSGLKLALDVADQCGLLNKMEAVVHPNVVEGFTSAVISMTERGQKLGSYTSAGDRLVEVYLSTVVIDGRHSVDLVEGPTCTTWHYEELDPNAAGWHAVVLAMLRLHEEREVKRSR